MYFDVKLLLQARVARKEENWEQLHLAIKSFELRDNINYKDEHGSSGIICIYTHWLWEMIIYIHCIYDFSYFYPSGMPVLYPAYVELLLYKADLNFFICLSEFSQEMVDQVTIAERTHVLVCKINVFILQCNKLLIPFINFIF